MLLGDEDGAPFQLRRKVYPEGPRPASTSSWTIEFDASPWGGGAVLRHGERCVEYFAQKWHEHSAPHTEAEIGLPKWQTFWEFSTLLLALEVWGSHFTQEEVAVLGDNTGSLQNAIDLKGRGPLLSIARELAWRKAKFEWKYSVGHLASEHNILADALSRMASPEPSRLPDPVKRAREITAPDLKSLWKLRD